jgi:hypothetical protein
VGAAAVYGAGMTEEPTRGNRRRNIAIWVFGLLASGIFGGLIADRFFDSGATGFFGGLFAFACARLWLTTPSKNSK